MVTMKIDSTSKVNTSPQKKYDRMMRFIQYRLILFGLFLLINCKMKAKSDSENLKLCIQDKAFSLVLDEKGNERLLTNQRMHFELPGFCDDISILDPTYFYSKKRYEKECGVTIKKNISVIELELEQFRSPIKLVGNDYDHYLTNLSFIALRQNEEAFSLQIPLNNALIGEFSIEDEHLEILNYELPKIKNELAAGDTMILVNMEFQSAIPFNIWDVGKVSADKMK